MKLKRFLAFIVAFAMVISVMPAMSLTVSAARPELAPLTDVASTINGAEVVWQAPQSDVYYDTPVSNAFEGWAVASADATINVREYDGGATGTSLQIYGGSTWGGHTRITAPNYAKGASVLIFEWIENWDVASSMNHIFYDSDGLTIANAWFDSNKTNPELENPFGAPANGSKLAIVCTNTSDGHTAEFYVEGKKTFTRSYDYQVRGFGGLGFQRYTWSTWHMRNLTISAVYPSTMTVNYVDENGVNIGNKNVGYAQGIEKTFSKEEVPNAISHNGSVYVRDESNSLTVIPDGNDVSIVYLKAKTITDANETKTAAWMATEFTLVGSAGYRDYYVMDAAGNKITGFCWAAPTDGFHPQDRQSLSDRFSTKDWFKDTAVTWTSNSTRVRIEVQKYSENEYNVQYVVINGSNERVIGCYNYYGSPVGLSIASDAWKSSSSGGNGDNFVFTNPVLYAVVPETVFPVTATYTIDDEVVHTVNKSYDTAKGESGVDFDAYYYSANGSNVMYKGDAVEGATENVTIEMTVDENWSEYSVGTAFTSNDIPYVTTSTNLIPNGNFEKSTSGWYGGDGAQWGASVSNNTATLSSKTGTDNVSLSRSWAIEDGKTYLFEYTTNSANTYHITSLQNDLKQDENTTGNTVLVGTTHQNTYVGELASCDSAGENRFIFTNEDGYDYLQSWFRWSNATVSNFGLYEIEIDKSQAIEYTIKATGSVDDTTTYFTTDPETIPIPHYDGHIMKTRTISGTTVTVEYEATEYSIGSWYMRNNFTDDNWITQSKYIGSHDAFADTDDVFDNEGGALFGDSFTEAEDKKVAGITIYKLETVIANSRAQSVSVLDQLNAGVRYFDIRLSRQNDGTFATVHGPAFENFRDVATTMAQWAKENPGEVIILDFQEVRDALYKTVINDADTTKRPYNGGSKGDDNAAVYAALVQLLEDTGLAAHFPTRLGETKWDQTYGPLTNYGANTVVLPFAKSRACNNQGGTFYNRSALNNDVTYNIEDPASNYKEVVSYLNNTYSNLTGGATISTIHAYATPLSLSNSGDSLLDVAATNNPAWINEPGFYNWMSYDKGDVLMLNDAVSDIDVYYAALNSFNRAGAKSGSEFNGTYERTDNGVTLTGPQANVPYSTKWTVKPTKTNSTYTIGDVTYTGVTAYELDLMQFNRDSVQPTGAVTVTFPRVSDDNTTVDVLLSADGKVVYQTANLGEAIKIETTALADVILATKVAPGVNVTVNYVDNGTTIYSETKYVVYNHEAYNIPAGDFYFTNSDGTQAWILNSAGEQKYTLEESVTSDIIKTVDVTVVSENAVLFDAFHNSSDRQPWNNDANMLFVGSAGVSDAPDADADNVATFYGGGNVGSARIPLLTFNTPTVSDGEAVKLNVYVGEVNANLWADGYMKLAVNVPKIAIEANETTNNYIANDYANLEGIVWSDAVVHSNGETARSHNNDKGELVIDAYYAKEWVTFDVTELVRATTGDKITFTLYAPRAGAYVVDREKAVAGGKYPGCAAYLDVVEANTIKVSDAKKVTKMGTDVTAYADSITVPVGSEIKIYTDAAYVTDGINTCEAKNERATVVPSADVTYYATDVNADLYIKNLDDFIAFRDSVNAGNTYEGKTVALLNDIDLSGVIDDGSGWTPIGRYHSNDDNMQHSFMGNFNGNGHTISGMNITSHDQTNWNYTGHYEGLFGYVQDATIRNFTLDDASIECYDYSGLVAGMASGDCTFENITVTNSIDYAYNCTSAGILGVATYYNDDAGNVVVSDIEFIDITVDSTNAIGALWDTYDAPSGGILGRTYKNCNVTMENCHVSAKLDVFNDVASNYQWWQYRRSGMLVGFLSEATNNNGIVETADKTSGTITVKDNNISVTFKDCYVEYNATWNQYTYCEFESAGQGSYNQYDEYKFRRTDKKKCYTYTGNEADEKHTTKADQHGVIISFNQLWNQGNYYTGFTPVREIAGVQVKYIDQSAAVVTDTGETFNSIQDAVYAVGNNGMIALASDVTSNGTIVIPEEEAALFALAAEAEGKSITINLMGNTITGVSDEEDFTLIENNGNLRIIDTVGTGALKTTGSNSTVIKNNAGSSLTLNGGDVEGANGVVLDAAEGNGGSLTVTGKSSVTGGVRLLGATSEEESSVTLSLADNSVDSVVYDKPELPTATVAELDNDNLTFALNFKADAVTEEQLEYYGSWYADYVIKVNKDIDLNANGGADGYLSGQYDAWSANWVNVPFEKVTLKANEGLKIMEYASVLMGKPGLKYTYKEVYEKVKDFDCGIFLEPAFIAANPDLEITLELRMYNNEDETESYTIGETYVFTIPALPTATVTEIDNDELTFALNFKADEVTEKQLNFYDNWYADYVLKINKDVTFNAAGGADGYLSGQYDAWSENWVNVPLEDVTLKADEELKIMEYASAMLGKPGLKVTYNDVYKSVKDFDCGVFFTPEFITANPDLKVTLELRMYNPADETVSYVIGRTYVFEPENVATIGEEGYKTLQAAFNAVAESGAEEIATITLCADTEEAVVVADGILAKLVTGGKSAGTIELGADVLLTADASLTVTGEGLVAGKDSEGTKFGYTTMPLGLEMVQGAQVRVGDGVNADGKVDGTESGLRFITKVNTSDTLVATDDNAEMGVVITAQGSTAKAKIKTEKWQEEGKLFTSALKNLAVGNFYRKFTATPYVVVDGIEFVNNDETNMVTRSIYQVAAGLLVKGNPEGDAGYEDEDALKEGEKLYAVLNAYVNQTGIRLVAVDGELKANTNLTASGAYGLGADELHFTVTNASYDVTTNVYKVTIEALVNAEIYTEGFLLDYIRINNNNKLVKEKVTFEVVDKKTVNLTFNAEGLLDRFESDNTTPDIGGEGFDPETQN